MEPYFSDLVDLRSLHRINSVFNVQGGAVEQPDISGGSSHHTAACGSYGKIAV